MSELQTGVAAARALGDAATAGLLGMAGVAMGGHGAGAGAGGEGGAGELWREVVAGQLHASQLQLICHWLTLKNNVFKNVPKIHLAQCEHMRSELDFWLNIPLQKKN